MHYKKSEILKSVIIMSMLIFWLLTIVYPFIWLGINSLKSTVEIFDNSWVFPKVLRIKNYIGLFEKMDFLIYFKNTILVTVISLFFLVFFSTMASFVLSRFKFKWKKIIYLLFIMGMMIPINTALIPLFILMRDLRFMDNLFTLPFPYVASSLPITIFILVGFMKSLPVEMEEAAVIDGCGLFRIYSQIVFPLSKPAITTITIFNSVWYWNEFLFPLLFTSSREQRTLSIGIRLFVSLRSADYGSMLAGIVVFIVPTLIFYFILNEKIIKGMTAGAIKG